MWLCTKRDLWLKGQRNVTFLTELNVVLPLCKIAPVNTQCDLNTTVPDFPQLSVLSGLILHKNYRGK